ncbi:polysaccharide biosynthesis tyrosine autokinase [Mycobacterium sp. 236(2023)]|uniref:polysaccharide biosynthesis tyrosine autokinase n=1 Tax=Mycobacterium sp. 236(2023) TaxID=3038163 RepID=UPI002415792A|nr:polysaccharide biosynthesis tyrosine autokinase [Mycobacterium sp. 236(2023)]MDG4665370.1 polysaccharide biosynthesis tyrosine autokinase [Mycobacterium sp. 236(2023)]
MDLRSYGRMLLQRWPVLVSVFLVVGAVLAAASFMLPSVYTTSVRIVFTSNLSTDTEMTTRQISDLYLNSRLKTYAELVTTNQVLQPVIDSLGLDTTVADLVEQTEVTIPAGTTVIEMEVSAPTAAEAASTANRIANEMPWAVASLEGASTVAQSPIKVSILQPADIPEARSSPNVKLNLVVAAGLAFICAVFAAVLVETFDNRVRRRRDVTASGASYLGGIPKIAGAKAGTLLLFAQQSREVRSIFRRIAMDVVYAVDATPKCLIVTSPRTGAGKTTVAANIAGALAEAGNRVAFIDADFRGRRLAGQVGIEQVPGITDLVSGRTELDESGLYRSWGGFTIVPCGGSTVDVGEMLAGEKFSELIRSFADRFDVVIVDAPPITNPSEASRFTQNVANVVVVAQAGKTRRAELRRVTGSLTQAGAKTLGVVLSRVREPEQPAPADDARRDDAE